MRRARPRTPHRALAAALWGGTLLTSHAAGAIVQGTEDTSDRAAVLLIAKSTDGSTLRCTGSVVASRTVLTAAHCVAPQAVGLGAEFWLFVGTDGRGVAPGDAGTIRVGRVDVDPEFDLEALDLGHDLAALRVDDPLGIPPLSLASPARLPGSLRIIGYGLASATDTSEATALVRRQTTVAVTAESGSPLLVVTSQSGPCDGDSGGPGLGQTPSGEELVSITSYTDGGCGAGAVLTEVAAYLPLVQGWIADDESSATRAPGCAVSRSPGQPPASTGTAALLVLFVVGSILKSRC